MNHIYRSIWNSALGCWVAASELTRAHCKRSSGGHAVALRGGLLALGVGLAPCTGIAQVSQWNAGSGGDWSTGGNWSSGTPTAVTSATLTKNGDRTTVSTAGMALKLYVERSGEVIVTTGGALVIGDLISLGGVADAGTARLTIQGGGTVSAARLFVGDGLHQAIVTVTGAGSSLTVAPSGAGGQRFLIGGKGAGELHIDAGANVTVNGTRTLHVGNIDSVDETNGTLFIGSGAGAGTLTADNVILNTAGSSVQFNHSDRTTFSAAISGIGFLTKSSTGTLVLSGDSSSFSGSTTVQSGSLLLNNAKLGGALTVGSGAVLAGNGTVGSAGRTTTVKSGATIRPGTSSAPGTLTVQGDLTFESGAVYQVQADPNGTTRILIDVAGTATLAGGVLHVGNEVDALTDLQVGKTYTILSASKINGTFDAATSNFAYLDAKLDYKIANQVNLQLQRKAGVSFASLSNTSNQSSAANALESLPSNHALYQHIETLPAGTPAAVFSSLSGDTHSTVMGSVNMLGAHAPNISQQHLRNNLTAGFRPGAPTAQASGTMPASALPSSKALPAWVEVVGHWQKMDGNSNAPGVKQNTTGLFLGADEEVGNSGWRVGGSVGYTSADAKVSSRDASADINSYSAAVYTGKGFSHAGSRINVIGGLAYTKHSIESERSVASLGQNLKADYSAHTAQLFAEVGYAMGQYDKQGFEPFVGITLGEQRTDSFKESGGFAALNGESSKDTLASTTLGVRAHNDFKLAGKNTRVRGSLGVRHAWGSLSQNRTMAFEGSSSFTVAGAPLARTTALVGLQAEMELSRSAALVLGYNGEYGSGSRDQSASVKVRWAF